MEYKFRDIEKKWQQTWKDTHAYRVSNISDKPKYYVLDMFPYPSGAGLHVGHPLGYIASDIYARYKRLKGFNVLHPMGYDAFGLPAEQYAIEHGVHPAVSTDQNINNFRSQLDNIGFCYDWEREVRTCDPSYYKWTQWIFLQLFNSFYNRQTNKAEPIANLVNAFEANGNAAHPIPNTKFQLPGFTHTHFTAEQWKAFDQATQQHILMEYRLAYCGYGEVNWCEALGTVLANDEVVNGVSERGGHPVVKKKLRQWYLRITEYAERLQADLDTLDWSDAMKEMQTNWIGKSSGAEITFRLTPHPSPDGEGNAAYSNMTADKFKWPLLKDLSRKHRRVATPAEELLWEKLRNNQTGHKVRRQHVIDGFIIDFAFLKEHILIEVDGGYHDAPDQQQYDHQRTAFLEEAGYTVLRFSNEEVLNNVEQVITAITQKLNAVAPLSLGRGVGGEALVVYTTRPDTIFGVDFMVIAPEHELVAAITTAEQQQEVEAYVAYVKSRSDRERQAEKKITGAFTGSYAINPFNGNKIPVWISEYVLAGYGTGAIMAVPCGDERDFKFAKHFNIPITNILGEHFNGEEANPTKDAILHNSGFLDGVKMRDAIEIVINKIEEMGIGVRKVNYKMRDAAFSRQRYWGEPFPIQWKNGTAYALPETELPLTLPQVDSYSPGPEGEGPLANIPEWVARELETNTMPGYAGSSWYFLRYMDPHNNEAFASRQATDYWNQVDLYIGGTEHAVGHLLYSRMWTKALYDLGHIGFNEPFKKLVNQGMIQGSSRFVFEVHINGAVRDSRGRIFVSKSHYETLKLLVNQPLEFVKYVSEHLNASFNVKSNLEVSIVRTHVNVAFVDGLELNTKQFGEYLHPFSGYEAKFILEDDGKYICDSEVEKMSKSKYNTVNPDDLVEKYGADTFRMYEMFLGPVEQSKPWDTKGIEGVHRFLKKLWRLFYDELAGQVWTEQPPTPEELKVLHRTIHKLEQDTERFSFNTAVSAFMVCVNELSDLKCHKRAVLQPLLVLLTPYAPHIAEELWQLLGNTTSILDAAYPVYNAAFTTETEKEYPVSINGKLRTTMNFSLDAAQADVEAAVLANEVVQKWTEGKPLKKFIFVKNKMINVVV